MTMIRPFFHPLFLRGSTRPGSSRRSPTDPLTSSLSFFRDFHKSSKSGGHHNASGEGGGGGGIEDDDEEEEEDDDDDVSITRSIISSLASGSSTIAPEPTPTP